MLDILMDVDGPLACFTEAFLDVAEIVTESVFFIDDVREYDIAKSLGLSRKATEAIYEHIRQKGFCRDILPQEKARAGLDRLRTVANVYACTTPIYRSPYWMHEREEWLAEHMGFDSKNLIFVSAKHLLRGDMLVDDKVSHVDHWQRRHPDGIAVLWTMRHNESEREAAGERFKQNTIRTCDWDVLYDVAKARVKRA